MRKLIESVERLSEARGEFDAERIIQSNGGLTNVNINRELPSKLYTGITGSGYGPDDVVKIYYRDQERLDSWLASSQGRRAEEVGDTAAAASDREDRRIPNMGNWGFRADHPAINRIFDSKVRAVGRDPSLADIKNKFDELRSELESGNHDVSRSYSQRQYLGAVAKQIRVDGLFTFDGKNVVMSEKGENGNYRMAGGGSERLARALADRGLFPQEAESSVGFLGGLAGGIGYSDEDRAQVAGANASRQGQQRMRTQARRFLELLAKRNQGTTVSDGITYISSLARLLTEALTDAEETEFQELLLVFKDTSSLDQIDDEETVRLITQARDAAKDIEPQADDAGDNLGTAPTDQEGGVAQGIDQADTAAADERQAAADREQQAAAGEGMSLADFAKSDKGGIKNDPGETRAITELQEFLKTMGWDVGVDGRYGPQTTAAVKEFQQLVGLTDDGDAGPQTIEKILVWGKLPDVKTWSAQLKELNELITAGAVFSTEPETQQTPPAQQGINSSKDFRSLISIVESMLKEAVTPQQQARAMELYNALKAKLDDGEYQSGLPQELQTQFSAVGEWARGAATGSTIDAIRGPDAETDQEGGVADGVADADAASIAADVDNMDAQQKARAMHDGIDGAGTNEQTVMAVLASIADTAEWQRVKSAFQNAYNEDMMDWVNGEVSFSDQDEVDAIVARLEGADSGDPGSVEAIANASDAAEGLYEAMKGGWLFGLGTSVQAILAILGKIQNSWENVQTIYKDRYQADLLQHLSEEFGGDDLIQLNGVLRRFNVEITGEGQWGAPSSRSERNGSTTVNGIAPDNEQEGGWIVLYWQGTKYYVNPIKQGNEYVGFRGSPTGTRSRVTSPALLTAVETEVERRRAAGTLTDPTATNSANAAAGDAAGDVTGYGSMSPEEIAAQAASGQGFGG